MSFPSEPSAPALRRALLRESIPCGIIVLAQERSARERERLAPRTLFTVRDLIRLARRHVGRERRRPMSPALPLLIPLGSGLGYAVAALMLKRGGETAGPWRAMFVTNFVIAALFAPAWFLPSEHAISPFRLMHAAISGGLFFIGQLFTFLALSRGDVSVATPVLGSKIVFVAFFAVLLGTETLTGAMWLAVALTAVATALLGGSRGDRSREAIFRSLIYGFSAAAVFALNDVTQQLWLREWDLVHYMATMFQTMAVLSLGLLPLFRGDGRLLSRKQGQWLIAGALLLGVQACGVAWGIVTIGPTTTNVLYNSRGVWSVVLVWAVGDWFGNTERAQGRAIMLRRLAASLLLLGAIFLLARR